MTSHRAHLNAGLAAVVERVRPRNQRHSPKLRPGEHRVSFGYSGVEACIHHSASKGSGNRFGKAHGGGRGLSDAHVCGGDRVIAPVALLLFIIPVLRFLRRR